MDLVPRHRSRSLPLHERLEALERVCDQLAAAGVPLANIVAVLLDGCENLAMPGLAVGLLVRHLEDADRLLDRYLAEPMIWHLEFARLTHESSGLAASSEGIVQAERRRWSLREAGMLLVLNADETRADELRAIGGQLVATARRLVDRGARRRVPTRQPSNGNSSPCDPGRAASTGRPTKPSRRKAGYTFRARRPTTSPRPCGATAKSCSAQARQPASWSATT